MGLFFFILGLLNILPLGWGISSPGSCDCAVQILLSHTNNSVVFYWTHHGHLHMLNAITSKCTETEGKDSGKAVEWMSDELMTDCIYQSLLELENMLPFLLTELKLFCIVQFLSHVRLFVTPRDCSTPGFPVLHHLLEFAQTHVHEFFFKLPLNHQ